MEVIYSGAHPEVVVDALDTNLVIKRGTPVTVPDDLGESLIQQDTWAAATETASAPSDAPTAPETPATPSEPVTVAPVASEAPALADATNGVS